MRMTIRATLSAGVALGTLAFAGTALASYTPKLVASSATPQAAGAGGSVTVGVVVPNTDDPTAKVQIYVPTGYQVATPAVGTKLGDLTATASAADLAGAILPLTGELDAIAPNAAAQAQCGVIATQTWDLHLTAVGQTLDVPVYVVQTSAPEAAAGFGYKLVVCLPPPDVPAGTPGRAAFGAKLLSATFAASAITEPTASGDYRWTSVWTPYTPGKGIPNSAGSVEVQSIRHVPTQIKLTVTKKKLTVFKRVKGKRVKIIRTLVRFSSAVTENTTAATDATITTTAAGKKVGGASGSFILAAGKSATVAATALVNHGTAVPSGQTAATNDLFFRDVGAGACVPTAIFAGLPCIDATVGASTVRATAVVKGYSR